MESEIWKEIPGWERYYKVSNLGNFISLERKIDRGNNTTKILKQRILKLCKRGLYIHMKFCRNGKEESYQAHKLVSLIFLPNPENKKMVNHKNGIKTDNRVENLEWCTAKENVRHTHATGLVHPQRGAKRYNAKLTEDEAFEILQLNRMYGLGPKMIARHYNLDSSTVTVLLQRKTWKHVKI